VTRFGDCENKAGQDIETVMAASTSLVRAIRRLTPLGVVKG